MNVLGVVLAAGASRRMGRPKALLDLDGEPLVAAHVRALRTVCDVVIVVVNEHLRVEVQADVVVNRDPKAQMIDSLRLALRDHHAGRVIVTPVDVPPAAPDTLARLLAVQPPAVPIDARGERGHPVVIGPDLVAAIRKEAPEGGLRTLLTGATCVTVDDPDAALDFDDPDSWASYLARRGRS